MFALRLPAKAHPVTRGVADPRRKQAARQEQSGPLGNELLDLYAAIAIVVPLALFLKSQWP